MIRETLDSGHYKYQVVKKFHKEDVDLLKKCKVTLEDNVIHYYVTRNVYANMLLRIKQKELYHTVTNLILHLLGAT